MNYAVENIPDRGIILGEGSQLLLHPEDPVDAVNEQNKDEDECNLDFSLNKHR